MYNKILIKKFFYNNIIFVIMPKSQNLKSSNLTKQFSKLILIII